MSQFETVRITKDGRLIDVLLSTSPVRYAAGAIMGAATIARDISDQKGMQEALRKSEANYRAVFQTSRDAIVVADAHTGKLLDANPAAIALLGRSLGEYAASINRRFILPARLQPPAPTFKGIAMTPER